MEKLLKDLNDSIESCQALIIESSPELSLKSKIIEELFKKYIPTPYSQLFIFTSDTYTSEKLAQELSSLNPTISGLLLTGSKPHQSFDHPKTCSKPSPNHLMDTILSFPSTFTKLDYNSDTNYMSFLHTLKQHIRYSQLIICTQAMLLRKVLKDALDPSIRVLAIFEDALQLDLAAIDHLSINLNFRLVSSALRGLEAFSTKLELTSQSDPTELQQYYDDCKLGNFSAYINPCCFPKNVTISEELLREPVLGSLRRPQFFLKMMKTVCVHLRQTLRAREAKISSCEGFLYKLFNTWMVAPEALEYSSLLFNTLSNVLKMECNENLMALYVVCEFCTLAAMNPSNYCVVYEPFAEVPKTLNPVLQLACQNPAEYLNGVFKSFAQQIIFTSSCTPSSLFMKFLGIEGKVHQLEQYPDVCALILTRGSDQVTLTTKSDEKVDDGIMRNYGEVLLELSEVVPDGILAVFPDVITLENYVVKWNESGALYRMLENKIVLIETDGNYLKILTNFRRACECGRGAILLSVARDKCVEKMNMFGEFLRCTLLFGVAQSGILSRVLKARLVYLKERHLVDEGDYLNFDAMRVAVAAAGQGLRAGSKKQVIILADRRFESSQKRSRIPSWIGQNLKSSQNISTDIAKTICSRYFKGS